MSVDSESAYDIVYRDKLKLMTFVTVNEGLIQYEYHGPCFATRIRHVYNLGFIRRFQFVLCLEPLLLGRIARY